MEIEIDEQKIIIVRDLDNCKIGVCAIALTI